MDKKEYLKIYHEQNKKDINQYHREYYQKNKAEQNKRGKNWKKQNPEKLKLILKKHNKTDKHQQTLKKWKEKNSEYIKNWYKIYNNKKYKIDINYRLRILISSRILSALKTNQTKKSNPSLILLGCSIPEYKYYLEQQFKPEMNWENHGQIWEIDHIKPCSSFDLTKLEEQQKCFHYTNLQPLFKTTEISQSFGYLDEIGNRNKSNNLS